MTFGSGSIVASPKFENCGACYGYDFPQIAPSVSGNRAFRPNQQRGQTMHVEAKPTRRSAELQPLVVDTDGLAQLLARSRRSVIRMRSRGLLPTGLRLNGRVCWRVSEINDWLEAGAPDGETWSKLQAAKK